MPAVISVRGLTDAAPWGLYDLSNLGPETAIKVSSVLSVVRWIAQAVAVMPWQVMQTMPDGRKSQSPTVAPGLQDGFQRAAYVIRKRPNAWQSAYEFWQLIAFWTALHGNAYARIVGDNRWWFSELRPMHPTRVRVYRRDDYSVFYEFLNDKGKWERLDGSEVIHWRWLSDNGLVGLAPVELCATSIGLARRLDQAATAYWNNSGRPDMVVETDEKIPEEAVAALRAAMAEVYGGPTNRGKTAVMPKKTKLKVIEQNTMEQAQFQELRDAILADVCRCWGVPSTLLGDHRMARWSNVEQEHLSAQVWCLLPWQRRLEGPLDMQLQPVYGEDIYCKLDNRGLLRADTASRVSLYQSLWNMGAISPNELRDLEDLPLLASPAADETFVQLGFSTLDNAAAQAATPADQAAAAPADAAVAAEPSVDSSTDPLAAAASGADLAATALNGAQVTALLEVLGQISAGTLDKDAAVALITSAFPTIAAELAQQMVAGAKDAPAADTQGGG